MTNVVKLADEGDFVELVPRPALGDRARRAAMLSAFFALGIVAGITFTGFWALLAACAWSAAFAVASLITARPLFERLGDALTARRYRSSFVTLLDLDEATRPLMVRARDAINVIMSSALYLQGAIDKGEYLVASRQDEWEIATDLKQLNKLRVQLSRAEASGPQSLAYVQSYTRKQNEIQTIIINRVKKLEESASQIKVADSTYCDHEDALKLRRLEDPHLDLLFETKIDERHAESQIGGLAQRALLASLALIDVEIEANEIGRPALSTLTERDKTTMLSLLVQRSRIHWMLRRDDPRCGDEALTDLARAIEIDPTRNDIRAEWKELRRQWRKRNE